MRAMPHAKTIHVTLSHLLPLAGKDARPTLNPSRFNTPDLQEILELCWHRDPNHRPHFYQIVRDLQLLRKSVRAASETPKGTLLGGTLSSRGGDSPSPDIRPNFTPPLARITLPSMLTDLLLQNEHINSLMKQESISTRVELVGHPMFQ